MSRKTIVFHFPAFLLFVLFLPAQAQTSPDDLLAKVQQQGQILVIAELELGAEFQAEGRLASAAADRQRSRIAQTGNRLVAELADTNASVNRRFQTIPAVSLKVDKEALELLYRSDVVKAVRENRLSAPSLIQSTPLVGAPGVWSQGHDGSGWTVVILDTGIDGTHPFFKAPNNSSRIVAEACFSNAGGYAGGTSLCPNGSHEQFGAGAAEAKTPVCDNGSLCDHGTHVAGISAGYSSGNRKGVAPAAGIIAIQVFTRLDDYNYCNGRPSCVMSFTDDQLAALDYVNGFLRNSHNLASVNMSLGGGGSSVYCDQAEGDLKLAIDNLRSNGIATVIANGNDGRTGEIGAPACISSSVAIGSSDKQDNISDFSDVASIMDLFAPGSDISSSINGGNYAALGGTSMAAPHVAGAWALLKQAKPSAGVDEILAALANTGKPISDNRYGGWVTRPRIRINHALDELLGGNLLVCGSINKSLAPNYDGSTFNFATGQFGTHSEYRPDDINLYLANGSMHAYWFGDWTHRAVGAVADSSGEFAVLQPGTTVGPSSNFATAPMPMTKWLSGAEGYLGMAFENKNSGLLNYGWIQMSTSSPNGYPASWGSYCYDKTGAAITVSQSGDLIFDDRFER